MNFLKNKEIFKNGDFFILLPNQLEIVSWKLNMEINVYDILFVEEQKNIVLNNTTNYAKNLKSSNCFLWGARGMGKSSLITDDFMIIARIESLILEKGIDDAIERAKAYIAAGADGIMIHSRNKSPDEIFEFCKIYNTFENRRTLIVVPSSYNQVFEEQLISYGVNIVIYANHLLRSAYPAMQATAESILKNGRSFECNNSCMPIKNILELVPGTV